MKEDILRGMIRKQIKNSLKEAPDMARATVGTSLGRVEKMAGVKMLKKALDAGTPQQKAAGLMTVIKAISGEDPQVRKMLARMLIKKDPTTSDSSVEEASSSALARRQGQVDKTQAMKMMKATLGTKPANQQAEFVFDLLNGLGLKDSAKQRIKMRIRQELGKK